MPWIAPVAAGAAMLGGSAIGAISKAGSDAQAKELIQKAVAQYDQIGVPPAESMQIILEELRNTGQMTPQLEQTFQQVDTEMKNISADPRGQEAQYQALQELEDLGMSGGMSLTDKAVLEDTMGDIDARGRGAREAINTSLKARGAYGSGAELAFKLQAQQGDSQLAHEAGLASAGKAEDRALQAIIAAGEMGGNLRNQDFSEKAKIAAAQDEINRFNAANRQTVAGANVNRQNTATDYNVRNDQRIADTNTQNRNANAVRNADLKQQEFENKMSLASGKANAYTGQANQVTQAGKDSAAMWGKVGQGVGQIATSLGDAGKVQPQGSTVIRNDSSVDRRYLGDDEERAYV